MKTNELIEAKMKDFREGWADDEVLEFFLATALNEVAEKAREETREDIIRDIKKYLKGKNMSVQTKDKLREFLNSLNQKQI